MYVFRLERIRVSGVFKETMGQTVPVIVSELIKYGMYFTLFAYYTQHASSIL